MINEDNILPEVCPPNLPPGVICIASGELARYPSFPHALCNLLRPAGTTIEWHCGLNVAANFNAGIRAMLANPALQWAWIMGDDHEFDETVLLRLLQRDKDILVPLVVRRQPPFIPVLFKKPNDDTPLGQFPPLWWHELPAHGLVGPEQGLYTVGSAGMLIKRHVLEAMADPWFELGKMGRELTNEDTYFCKKAQEMGFEIYADMDVQMHHWTPMALVPLRTQKGWTVGMKIGNDLTVALPPEQLKVWGSTVKDESAEFLQSQQGVS